MDFKLSIRELVAGWPCSWRYVNRYSTSRCVRPENVAEHTAFVCLYAAAIVKWVVYNRRNLEPAVNLIAAVMTRAAVHDLEECRTGDIHRPFKYSDPALKGHLDRASGLAMKQIVDRIFPGERRGLRDEFYELWSGAKEGEAGRIVRFADYLSVVSFVAQEGRDAPERLCLDTMRASLNEFTGGREYDFIRELVQEAEVLTQEVLGEQGR